MITREHDFKAKPKHPRTTITQMVWRCDKCDSEVIFPLKRGYEYVNKIMMIRLKCIDPSVFKN